MNCTGSLEFRTEQFDEGTSLNLDYPICLS
jgi:hypothetical protein